MASLVQFVLSLNLHRRHLTSSQKAVLALDIKKLLADPTAADSNAQAEPVGCAGYADSAASCHVVCA